MNYNIEVSLENNDKFSTFLNTMIKEFNNEHYFKNFLFIYQQ